MTIVRPVMVSVRLRIIIISAQLPLSARFFGDDRAAGLVPAALSFRYPVIGRRLPEVDEQR
jgi:hypothetical protein